MQYMAARLNIAIVGGGIGGLFAANALIARGLQVAVYEQALAIGEIGAGVYVTPNAVRHLESVGLGGEVERWGARVGPASAYFRAPRFSADGLEAGLPVDGVDNPSQMKGSTLTITLRRGQGGFEHGVGGYRFDLA